MSVSAGIRKLFPFMENLSSGVGQTANLGALFGSPRIESLADLTAQGRVVNLSLVTTGSNLGLFLNNTTDQYLYIRTAVSTKVDATVNFYKGATFSDDGTALYATNRVIGESLFGIDTLITYGNTVTDVGTITRQRLTFGDSGSNSETENTPFVYAPGLTGYALIDIGNTGSIGVNIDLWLGPSPAAID